MTEAWNVQNEAVGRTTTKEQFVHNGVYDPSRELLHETITQAVTERRIITDPSLSYDQQLFESVDRIRESDAYKQMEQSGNFSRDDVSRMLDNANLERLPEFPTAQQVTTMVTGGPATGKSGLVRMEEQANPDVIGNSARINPDDYKPLLADPAEYGSAYADIAHGEGSDLTNRIMGRLEEKMQAGQAPHVILDVVAPNDRRMSFAQNSGSLVVITGTAPPEVTVERAYARGIEEGRQVPTEIVLEGASKVPESLPRVLDHPNVEMAIYNTDVPRGTPPERIAHYDPETSRLIVSDPDAFADFVERQNLNRGATAPEQLYPEGARTPEKLAQGLSAYTDRGVSVEFQTPDGKPALTVGPDGVTQTADLDSKRGQEFFEDVGRESSAMHASKAALSTPEKLPDTRAPHSITEEFGRRAGVVVGAGAGLIVGGAALANGAGAAEAAMATAETAVPFVSAGVALEEGRTTEAAMRAVEEVPFGIVATEIARPAARALGADVDPSIGQMVIDKATSHAAVSPEQQEFMRVFDSLPTKATPDMPPEVASLVEQKSMILQAEAKFEGTNSSDITAHQSAQRTLENAENGYTEQYDTLLASGGKETVDAWIHENPMPDAVAPSAAMPVMMASTPAAQQHRR